MKKNGKQPTTLDALQAQRGELAARLGAVGGQLARLDPVNDWEICARALGEQSALERAVQALDERIAAARLAERDTAAAERDAARQEAAQAARIRVDVAARAVCDLVQSFDANELAELRAAARELVATGDIPTPAAGVAMRLVGAVDAALAQWRVHAPTWLGLPEPPSREAQALAERQAAVKTAEERLEKYRKMRANAKHNEPSPDEALLRTVAFGLVGARQSLLRLTEPDADQVTVMNRSYGGINELAEHLGGWHERYNAAQRKAQREEKARASLMA